MNLLQQDLTQSLTALLPTAKQSTRLNAVISAVKASHIPDTDYSNVSKFIYLVVNSMPDTLNNPNNQQLKTLAITCINHVAAMNELKEKTASRKR